MPLLSRLAVIAALSIAACSPGEPAASAPIPAAAVNVTIAIEPQSAPASALVEPISSSPWPLGSSTNMNGTRNAGVVYFQHCSVVL